jgi:hypothetical protein
MTKEEIHRLSTPRERWAEGQWRRLQREAEETGTMGETALLEASEAIGVLVERNKRLGLIPAEEKQP